jgi:hypothetical protein
MNRLSSYISRVFGTRDITGYRELYYKSTCDASYNIVLTDGTVSHEVPETPRSLDWRLI